MSPSKKANKQDSKIKTRSAQQAKKKTAVRSSRVPTKKTIASKSRSVNPAPPSSENIIIQNIPAKKSDIQSETRGSKIRTNILRALALAGVIAITIYIISIREHVAEFKQYGYLGVFFVALLANATVFIPAPGVAIIYAMGAIFNPIYVGLAAGTGGAIGELSGFLAGFSGQAIIENSRVYERIKPWVDKYGGLGIFSFDSNPNPLFFVVVVLAVARHSKKKT